MSMTEVIERMGNGVFGDAMRGIGVEITEERLKDYAKANMQEHRCPCGRLLGKFAGRAEVKCYDCGRLNIIGGENG